MKKSKAPEVPKPRETVTLSEDRIDQFRETFAGEICILYACNRVKKKLFFTI